MVLGGVIKGCGILGGDGIGVGGVDAEIKLSVLVDLIFCIGDGELVGMDGAEFVCFACPN